MKFIKEHKGINVIIFVPMIILFLLGLAVFFDSDTPERKADIECHRRNFLFAHPDCEHYKEGKIEYFFCKNPNCAAWMTITDGTISQGRFDNICSGSHKESRKGAKEILQDALDISKTPHNLSKHYNEDGSITFYCDRCGLTITDNGKGYTINRTDFEKDVKYCHKEEK